MSDRRQRDKDQTLQDIFAAARRLFSENGLHGTSIRDIETASGVSKGLILHHFGGKENLYAAVQDLLIEEYVGKMAARRHPEMDLGAMIAATIQESLVEAKTNHQLQRITLWSYLEGQERATAIEQHFTTRLIDIMRSGQEAGLVREDIPPLMMPFIIKGTIDYWIRKRQLIQRLSADSQKGEVELDQDLVDTLTRLFLK